LTAASGLARLRELGVNVEVCGDRLTLRPASAVPADLLADLRAHKAEVLVLLSANDADAWGMTAADRAAAMGRLRGEPLPPVSPEQAPDEEAERAAIAAVDGGADPTYWRLTDHMAHAAHLRQLQDAALQRPPSWPGADRMPTPGAWCSCCRGSRWWREREHASGWCCSACHPADHLPAAGVLEVRT
jgi:hypothetical protein